MLFTGGGGKGGWGSAVIAGEWHAAAAMSPFTVPMNSNDQRSMLEGIAGAIQNKDWVGAMYVAKQFPGCVVQAAPQSIGLAIGGGLIRGAGRWMGW